MISIKLGRCLCIHSLQQTIDLIIQCVAFERRLIPTIVGDILQQMDTVECSSSMRRFAQQFVQVFTKTRSDKYANFVDKFAYISVTFPLSIFVVFRRAPL
jgi:hypothetical protein